MFDHHLKCLFSAAKTNIRPDDTQVVTIQLSCTLISQRQMCFLKLVLQVTDFSLQKRCDAINSKTVRILTQHYDAKNTRKQTPGGLLGEKQGSCFLDQPALVVKCFTFVYVILTKDFLSNICRCLFLWLSMLSVKQWGNVSCAQRDTAMEL